MVEQRVESDLNPQVDWPRLLRGDGLSGASSAAQRACIDLTDHGYVWYYGAFLELCLPTAVHRSAAWPLVVQFVCGDPGGCRRPVRSADGRVLVDRRLSEPGRPLATPAGSLDPGETVEAWAVRELTEETGLVVRHARTLTAVLITGWVVAGVAVDLDLTANKAAPHVREHDKFGERAWIDPAILQPRDKPSLAARFQLRPSARNGAVVLHAAARNADKPRQLARRRRCSRCFGGCCPSARPLAIGAAWDPARCVWAVFDSCAIDSVQASEAARSIEQDRWKPTPRQASLFSELGDRGAQELGTPRMAA
jgi:8-oxo-dGTP pyrophosphatase MutT (NUDIX family)